MQSSVEARIKAATPIMTQIVKEYKEDNNAQMIDLMLKGQQELLKHGLGNMATVHSSKTLTMPRNRGGGMLDIAEVPAKVADISDVAFSDHEVGQAAAVRLPPVGTEERANIERKTPICANKPSAPWVR
jgi:hypothetical protein